MHRESSLKRLLFDCGTRDGVAAAGLLLLRAGVGLMMLLGHGLDKLRNFDTYQASWHVPDFFPFYFLTPSASLMATIAGEVVAAALLVLGLLTRPAAFLLGFVMVVAAFEVHGAAPWTAREGPSKELALLYLLPLVVLLLTGAGAWSADAGLHRAPKRRNW